MPLIINEKLNLILHSYLREMTDYYQAQIQFSSIFRKILKYYIVFESILCLPRAAGLRRIYGVFSITAHFNCL